MTQKTQISTIAFASLMVAPCMITHAHTSAEQKKNTSQTQRPNVILIMADDLGWGDTGFNGNTIIKTPHLDKLAQQGIQFTRFYSASTVSSPTRASVLTGRNPYRTGVFNANCGILRPEEITLPELLRDEGYLTGHFGKWHLGSLTTKIKDSNRGRPGEFIVYNPPKVHGYDVAFVSESKVPTWDPMRRPLTRKEDPNSPYKKLHNGWRALGPNDKSKHFGTHYFNIKGDIITDNLQGDDSRVIMDRVIPFIEKSVKANKPFLSTVWFHAPHKPCVAGPKYTALYKEYDWIMQNYAGCITAMDEQIGRLVAHLHKLGITENTMIWFCSDNGPEVNGPGTTSGFRDRKRSLHEGGVRVPGLFIWPALIKKHKVIDFPAVTSDYLPTIVAALDINPSKLRYHIDGINLLPALQGRVKERITPIISAFMSQLSFTTSKEKIYMHNGQTSYYHIDSDPYELKPNSMIPTKAQEKMDKIYQSYKKSFEGDEYGTKSVERLKQKWSNSYKRKWHFSTDSTYVAK